MSVNTMVVWNNGTPTESEQQTIKAYVQVLVANGDTDGIQQATYGPTTWTAVRTWVDMNAADAWITYITSFNPVSAEVIL